MQTSGKADVDGTGASYGLDYVHRAVCGILSADAITLFRDCSGGLLR